MINMIKQKKIFYLGFFIVWFLYFQYLEKNVSFFIPTNLSIDDRIPFLPVFIIPYLIWFVYVGITYLYFYKKDNDTFIKMAKFISIGMTIFLIICTFFPNGLDNFRIPIEDPSNLFETLTYYMQLHDTSTNVFPSIHVYNSLGITIAICHYQGFKHKKMIRLFCIILCILICLSTLFLKQHSLLDVFASGILAISIYYLIYK